MKKTMNNPNRSKRLSSAQQRAVHAMQEGRMRAALRKTKTTCDTCGSSLTPYIGDDGQPVVDCSDPTCCEY